MPKPEGHQTSAGRGVDPNYRLLYRFFLSRLRRREDAEDLAQEAYLRLLRVPHPDLIHEPTAYLLRIASNLVFEFRLRARRSRIAFDSEQAAAAGEVMEASEPPSTAEGLLVAGELERAIDALPAKARLVLVLHRRDGLTYAQIAERLGISEDMVKKYLGRAIARCRWALGEGP